MTSEVAPAAPWTKRVRIILGIAIIIISGALLIWGLWPARHEIRTQPIPPSELQLPTPTSMLMPAPPQTQSYPVF